MQHEMFKNTRSWKEQDTPKVLLMLFEMVQSNQLQIPPHQRRFVWSDEKVQRWAKTIRRGHALGVIATYQLNKDIDKGHTVLYLNDGRQRLGAIDKISKSPMEYGFKDKESLFGDLKFFEITVQHRYYNSHAQAMTEFQLLNLGTGLTPAEFLKGIITLTDYGVHAYDSINNALRNCIRTVVKTNNNTTRDDVRTRIALGMFFKFVTKDKRQGSGNLATTRLPKDTSNQVETKLAEWMETKSLKEFDKELSKFIAFLDSTRAMIETKILQVLGEPKAMSEALCQCLIFAAIYRVNHNIPVSKYAELLDIVFEHSHNLTAQIAMPDNDERPSISIKRDELSKLAVIARAYKCNFFDHKSNRSRNRQRPGYDDSHKLPFSTNGDGETFAEPASLNRARGANAVDDSAD